MHSLTYKLGTFCGRNNSRDWWRSLKGGPDTRQDWWLRLNRLIPKEYRSICLSSKHCSKLMMSRRVCQASEPKFSCDSDWTALDDLSVIKSLLQQQRFQDVHSFFLPVWIWSRQLKLSASQSSTRTWILMRRSSGLRTGRSWIPTQLSAFSFRKENWKSLSTMSAATGNTMPISVKSGQRQWTITKWYL